MLDFRILLALVNGKTSGEQELLLDEMDRAFELKSAELDVYRYIRTNNLKRITEVLNQRAFGGLSQRACRRKHPFAASIRRVLARLGVRQNRARLARKYGSLGSYAAGTLGREYHDFLVRHRLFFPGDAGFLGEHLVHHDLCHVLGEFGTSAEEEVLVVSFQAACQKHHPCFSLPVNICLLHLGLEATGSAVLRPQTMKWMPEPWFRALRRGANSRVDFSDGWNFGRI